MVYVIIGWKKPWVIYIHVIVYKTQYDSTLGMMLLRPVDSNNKICTY